MAETRPSASKRARRSDAAINAAKLLETARRLLADDPNATLARIAEEAGVGRGTLYHHYPTRKDLLEAVRRQARDDAEVDQDEHLRPPGELANTEPTPLSVTEVLNKVPPFQLAEQVIAEAQRLAGVISAAIYLIDLDGELLLRLAGAATFPAQIPVPLAVGPEIPRDGVEALRASIGDMMPAAAVAPLYLRGRATGVLLALGTADDALRDLAGEAAVALALGDHYTDAIETVRRARHTSAAAEIQQNLLPPRIVRISGATMAGNVLPGYEIGGDWFDYAENPDRVWLGIADADGVGPRAAALGAVTLGAFRAARHQGREPAGAIGLMDDVLREVSITGATSTATIGCWNAPFHTFEWVTCGHPAPIVISADGELEVLDGTNGLLGSDELAAPFTTHTRRLETGQRLLLVSDGILDRTDSDGRAFGLEGVRAAAQSADVASAATTVRAIEDAVRAHDTKPLVDDATLICLAPNPQLTDND